MRDAFAESGEFAVKLEATSPSKPANRATVPRDGWEALSYDATTNRITTAGFEYDAAGNQTQSARMGGGSQRYQYDAAHRLVKVYDGNNTLLQTVTYGATNQRLVVQDGDANSNNRTYYVGDIMEYVETATNPTTPAWSKSYIYLGGQILATFTPNGGGEYTQYHHPDRLGTRLLTNATDTTAQEQATLPFGAALDAESTGATNRRFTSYDRSAQTGLDYALNRTYDSQQGRFAQVDPIGMQASSLGDPQSLNMYGYVGNDPINRVDPDGLFWGKLFRVLGKVLKWVAVAVTVAVIVLSIVAPGSQALAIMIKILAGIGKGLNFASGGALAAEGASAGVLAGIGLTGLQIAGAVGAIASNFAKSKSSKGFLCPQKASVLVHYFSRWLFPLFTKFSGHRTDSPLENGGWIYQHKNGRLSFKKAEEWRRKSREIDLANPPPRRGARVIAKVHTHPYTNKEQDTAAREGRKTWPSQQDADLANAEQLPSIVVYESGTNSDGSPIASIDYVGPDRVPCPK